MNIIEDDRPLQGPWSRRPAEAPQERNFPDREAKSGYGGRDEYDDTPLQGPWSRRPAETPPERNLPDREASSPGEYPTDNRAGDDYRSRGDYDGEPRPLQRGQRREVPTLRREEPYDEPAVHGHSFKIKSREPEEPGADSPVPQFPREAVSIQEKSNINDCPGLNNPRALLGQLFSASGIYAGVVMAEVLGSRGGRFGHRYGRY